MKLLSLVMIVFLISVCNAHPPYDYVGPKLDSSQPRIVQEVDWSFSSPYVDSVMDSSSTVQESQPMDEDGSPFADISSDLLGMIALKTSSCKDVMNFALASKPFYYAPTVKVIRTILRFCSVRGETVHPILELAAPPTAECAESIIASNGHFHIETLVMTNMKMTMHYSHSVASIVKHTNLLHLDLSLCKLANEGAIAIGRALPESKLASLRLGWNHIGNEGARAIGSALPESMLTSLNLGGNHIGDEGARAIAASLPESKLTSLYLGCNEIGDEGAVVIAAALPESKLMILDLCYIGLTPPSI